ncbi:MAG TPA: archease [Sandaracinaceae bacterium LLY-WYZ-13_1]|nr:archease [Sandaracinaceae bacterium LLY-WYZ-13_1]
MRAAGTHRFFDHTGDFGADLCAPDRAALYEASAHALVALLTDARDRIEARETRAIEVEGVDPEDLLVALGNEVLFLFETEGWLPSRLEVESVDDERLVALAHGEPYDPERHPIARPIKAVTHHGAAVEEGADGTWTGRLIFDL